jgi:hypothetical protein
VRHDPIPLVLVEVWPLERRPGMVWRATSSDEDGRDCWWVELPHVHPDLGTRGHPSEISWRTTDRASDPPHQMWTVEGTPPNLTVTPSIDVLRHVKRPNPTTGKDEWVREGSYWHGWIRDGRLVQA